MKKSVNIWVAGFIAGLFFVSVPLYGQDRPLSPRYTQYKMEVRLDPVTKVIDGKMILDWKNPSADTVQEIQFHLYLNAFKNTRSTFIKESGGALRGMKMDKKDSLVWGWTDILKMQTAGGDDLTGAIRYIHPDDHNAEDQTVIAVTLPRPVMPHDSIRLLIDFRSKLPKIFARTGYSHDYFLVAQWFPKPGVYEPAGMRGREKGGWNCHQFHAHSEFYANFSVYRVKITLPQQYVVGAVGELKDEKDNGDSTKTLTWLAEDVVDFAWTASPRFRVVEDQWRDVKIRALLQPEHYAQAARHTESLKAALDFFDKHLGPYPYHTATIVDPPLAGSGSGGMEYPTFFTAGCVWKMPEEIRLTEMVTIHEFGHTYFMGILATNEFEEAWMDEGMNTWFETRIMDATYGEKTSFVGFKNFHFGDLESQRLGYTTLPNPKIAEVARTAWGYPAGGYGVMSYNKPTTWLETLRRLVGDETMEDIMKTYYDRWKFKHPCGKDFIAVVNEVVKKHHGDEFGEDMDWFFDEMLYGSDVCDYSLYSIRNKKVRPPLGIHDVDGKKVLYRSEKDAGDTLYRSQVTVARLGEMIMPVEVLIRFSDSTEVTERWDGRARTTIFTFEKPAKVIWARVDPQEKILVDINLQNNSRTTKRSRAVVWKYALKYLYSLQHLMLTLSSF
jgi:hypothetical protein